ncbi:MAG: redox-sensing transcriptional repressor Rex [Kiritimatiellae bacterium]|nr:redox-sensing transcriptional repressor Rex [Kiritimatiellia bacterium]
MTEYLAHARELCRNGEEWVSSSGLAETLGLTSSTVRQDLSHVEFSGTSKRGYSTAGLVQVLTSALGADRQWRSIVMGVGNLGRALAQHREFERQGFDICGVFDDDCRKVGTHVGELMVQPTTELKTFVSENQIKIGILAVPATAAQEAANELVEAGITGLLNLSITHIATPRDIAVVDARIVASLLELSYAIKALEE